VNCSTPQRRGQRDVTAWGAGTGAGDVPPLTVDTDRHLRHLPKGGDPNPQRTDPSNPFNRLSR